MSIKIHKSIDPKYSQPEKNESSRLSSTLRRSLKESFKEKPQREPQGELQGAFSRPIIFLNIDAL